jgi:FAD:protein FMN transferase
VSRSPNRRRFLTLLGSATLLPMAAHAERARWQGTALGARATMVLTGLNQQDAAPIFAAVEAELERLELIFSLCTAPVPRSAG